MPKVIGARPVDRWENEVLKALIHQLSEDWVVLPSVKWTLEKNGYVRDGEADFVVLVPESGMIVVEVKGSKEFKVLDDGTWSRRNSDGSWTQLKESPPEQATRNMHDLVGCLRERFGCTDFPGRYGYLVVYPQGEALSLPTMFDESTIATWRHMNQIASRLRRTLDRRDKPGRGNLFSKQVIESIVDHLKDRSFQIQKVDTEEDVDTDFGKIKQLTRQQFASLKGLFELPNVAVIGPAGSGKTVLGIWRLKALIDEGQRALYVCFNRALAEALQWTNPDHAEYIFHIDKLFLSFFPDAKQKLGNSEFHRETLPGMVIDKAGELAKYDAILIDEGQDFSEDQIIALHDLLAPKGRWAFLADWRQDLYSAGESAPIGAEVIFYLHYNCRNTIKINQATNTYLNTKIDSMPGMPEGTSPIVEYTKDQGKRAWELARQWSGSGGVAILSPFKYENSVMKGQKVGHGLRLSTDIRDLGKEGTVYFSTIKSFKGIEAASIIVVELTIPGQNRAFTDEDLYVACTRATSRLALISSRKEVAKHYGC
ncbi:nuclease-related domain-containing DEAD/DEAH box helicase [Spiribacter onubensis]|uniref:NERD domain-containing protein n=1 Tax=Spiribacter onubensis TaxID=3122420 RepID=A0ABV3S7C1_9GAMM